MPAGYMDALGKLYGKPAEDGPKSATGCTQSTGVLPVQLTQKETAMTNEITEVAGALTPRQEMFAVEYARTGNASNAARVAGYSLPGAAQQGHALLRNPNVLARVSELQAEWHAQQIAAIRDHVAPAIQTLAEISRGDAPASGAQARVMAACALLDRAGFQPIQKVETNQQTAIIVQVAPDDMAL